MAERRTAGMTVEVDNKLVARLTSFGNSISVAEEMTSGAGDTTTEDNAIIEKYVPVSVGETANVGGITLITDVGRGEIEEVIGSTKENVVIKFRYENGDGTDYTGFFTNFENTGELPNVFRFTAQFRVNSKSAVTG